MISSAFRDMIAKLLPESEIDLFFDTLQQPLKKSLSIQRHHAADFEAKYSEFELTPTPFGTEIRDTYYVDREDITIALGKTRQHLTGAFYIQEVAASLPANILKQLMQKHFSDREGPLYLLDLCAAPGGKTAQLADYLLRHHKRGLVWGNDVETKRLGTRATNIQRCGLYNTVATKLDGSQIGNLYPEFFDAMLVDVPCSGEGTGFKSDAAYKRRKEESINKIVGLQEHIITSAVKACKPGGLIIYSTCTLNPFENELQIYKLLQKYGDALEVLDLDIPNKSPGLIYDQTQMSGHEGKMLRCWPHRHHTGGFFVCALRKKASTLKSFQEHITNKKQQSLQQAKTAHTKATQPPFHYSRQTEQSIKQLIESVYGITLDSKTYTIIQGKHKVYLADPSVRALLDQGVWLYECGIPIMKSTGRTRSLEHEFALALGHLATQYTLELTTEEIQRYCLGEELSIDSSRIPTSTHPHWKQCNDYIILIHEGRGVGVGKIINGTLKNKFFKW